MDLRYFEPARTAATLNSNDPGTPATSDQICIRLSYRGQKFDFAGVTDVTIGRAPDNDLVVSLPWVSRRQAIVKIRQNHLYLADTSVNGTTLHFEGRHPELVCQRTVLLPIKCFLSVSTNDENQSDARIGCTVRVVD